MLRAERASLKIKDLIFVFDFMRFVSGMNRALRSFPFAIDLACLARKIFVLD